MPVTHIAGQRVIISDRYLRQRCAWCTDVLLEYDLTRIAVPEVAGNETADPTPATWPPGALVTVDGHASWTTDGAQLPDDACALNPLTLASFTTEAPADPWPDAPLTPPVPSAEDQG